MIVSDLPQSVQNEFNKSLLSVKLPSFLSGVPMSFESYRKWQLKSVTEKIAIRKPKRAKDRIKAGVKRRWLASKQLPIDYDAYAKRVKERYEIMTNSKFRPTSGTTLRMTRYNPVAK